MLYKTLNMQPKQNWHQHPQPPCATLEKRTTPVTTVLLRAPFFTTGAGDLQSPMCCNNSDGRYSWLSSLVIDPIIYPLMKRTAKDLKINGRWNLRFWGPAYFQNLLLVSGSVCIESYRLTRCLHVIDTFDTLHPRWCRVSSTTSN